MQHIDKIVGRPSYMDAASVMTEIECKTMFKSHCISQVEKDDQLFVRQLLLVLANFAHTTNFYTYHFTILNNL